MALPIPTGCSSLAEWLDYQLSVHAQEIDMGLERVTQVATRLALTSIEHSKVITVAGTNGKGSTCAMLETALLNAGYTVGVYSSPHIIAYNERVRVNGSHAVDALFINAFHEIEKARQEIPLTFFEYATLAGLYILKQAALDVVILEVGLGGRLDATNIIDADVSVITSIDIDHQSYLGDTREAVAFEKAGIFRKNQQAIIGEPNPPSSLLNHGKTLGTQMRQVGIDFAYAEHSNSWCYTTTTQKKLTSALPFLPIANAATCLAVLESSFTDVDLQQAMESVSLTKLSGRFELLSERPKVIADVAHNPHAAAYLAHRVSQLKTHHVYAICGMLDDKDIPGVLLQMVDVVDHWSLVDLNVPRGAKASLLGQSIRQTAKYSEFDQLFAAWNAIKTQIHDDDVVIVFGSFYTVSAFKSLMQQEAICV
ncbi:bifunctional tetrahydrofolate synthase/dihydrofolate synthase [Shewanella gelidii]|uniref:Dihydrofolate synthase/folylpolyglutamate synthase n=1 Tax=Shewanella gelidii TaxID=1642821 RepID=A0A917NAN8_9GAMM|nr:bifunctional tetrahydrofolate synthase/dihydrofolate synthase [Shewanella gelidii]MCL1098241.1 bifunctional tetrahydrofolate synthase/dihydrofolate synthase [Shewanella gelidii]GGI83657.1 bifunctional folylpolyglutamate synthase/dihydrofolate synthase [Shewanella gelidii]